MFFTFTGHMMPFLSPYYNCQSIKEKKKNATQKSEKTCYIFVYCTSLHKYFVSVTVIIIIITAEKKT